MFPVKKKQKIVHEKTFLFFLRGKNKKLKLNFTNRMYNMGSKSVSKYIKNDEDEFVCPSCDIVKKNQNTMYYHMKKHEGKLQFECDICKKDFVQRSSLELHKISKHKNTPKEEMFACVFDDCDSESLTKSNRRIHCLRKHFKEEIFAILDGTSCTACKIEFKSLTAFYYHAANCIKVSTSEKTELLRAIL